MIERLASEIGSTISVQFQIEELLFLSSFVSHFITLLGIVREKQEVKMQKLGESWELVPMSNLKGLEASRCLLFVNSII